MRSAGSPREAVARGAAAFGEAPANDVTDPAGLTRTFVCSEGDVIRKVVVLAVLSGIATPCEGAAAVVITGAEIDWGGAVCTGG